MAHNSLLNFKCLVTKHEFVMHQIRSRLPVTWLNLDETADSICIKGLLSVTTVSVTDRELYWYQYLKSTTSNLGN